MPARAAGLIFKITLRFPPDFVIPEFPWGTFPAFSAGLVSLLMFLLFGCRENDVIC